MGWWIEILQAFLLTASALFSIVNPMGGALIFAQVTSDRSHAERVVLARKVAIYAEIVMLVSMWAGAYVLAFFGITIAALRIGGGLVVAVSGWRLLSAPEHHEDRKQAEAQGVRGADDIAFFPLTMPLTTGPGTISVAIAIGANRATDGASFWAAGIGSSLGAVAVAVAIYLAYSWADWITGLLGQSGVRVIGRLAAFILLCVGVQITLSGVLDTFKMAGIGTIR